MKRHIPILALLIAQAALLFANLDLLSIWTDELFTWQTVRKPVGEILPILQRDIHPPLYYLLLHAWPWHSLAGLRAFSGLWGLAATLLLDLLWTRHWKPQRRWLALILFALSPCLLLYGRMARSYTMQTALAIAAVWWIWNWIRTGRGAPLAFLATTALLYTHYVPGLAILAGFALAARRPLGLVRTTGLIAAVSLAYLPWLLTLSGALQKWGEAGGFSSRYLLTGSPLLEQSLKIGFGLVSLTVGETFPAASLLLVPLALVLIWIGYRRTARASHSLAILLPAAAVIGYIGVSRWVSYPFIPARLLWLLPFMAMGIALAVRHDSRWRLAAAGLLIASSLVSSVLYFRRDSFLNKGYAAPLREIASLLDHNTTGGDLILFDAYNTDFYAFEHYVTSSARSMVLEKGHDTEARSLARHAHSVWIVRNTRDISPGMNTSAVEAEACAGRHRETRLFMPYEGWQKLILDRMMTNAPTHFYQVTACTSGPRPAAASQAAPPDAGHQ